MSGERVAHYLKPITGRRSPLRILCAATSGHAVVVKGSGGAERRITVNAWAVEQWTWSGNEWHKAGFASGSRYRQFWPAVGQMLHARQHTWLFMMNAVSELSCTGFWDLLEDKTWTLGSSQDNTAGTNSSEYTCSFSGFAVLSDPPVIVLAKQAGLAGVVRIVDCKNYGLRGYADLDDYAEGELSPSQTADVPGVRAISVARTRSRAIGGFARGYIDTVRENGWGNFEQTGPRQSFTAYRARYIKAPILVHNNQAALRLERDAYHGGRCECFRIGHVGGETCKIDVVSCYPAVARDAGCPVRLVGYDGKGSGSLERLIKQGYCVIADVLLAEWHARFPCVHEGKTIYPVGMFQANLAGPELEVALADGRVLDVFRVAWYEPSCIFRDFVDDMFAIKSEAASGGNVGRYNTAKLMLNGIWGMLAARSKRWQPHPLGAPFSPWCEWYEKACNGNESIRCRALAGKAEWLDSSGEGADSMPAVAAWITSLARRHLAALIEHVGRKSIHYVDTDGMLASKEAADAFSLDGLVDPSRMGELKIEGRYDWCRVWNLKNYETSADVTHSGVPDGAERIGSWDWRYWSHETFASSLRRGRPPEAVLLEKFRRAKERYRHGTVLLNGTVEPLELRSWKVIR